MAFLSDVMTYFQVSKDNRRLVISGNYPKSAANGDTFKIPLTSVDESIITNNVQQGTIKHTYNSATQILTLQNDMDGNATFASGIRVLIRGVA